MLLAGTGCTADDDFVDDSGDCVDGKCDDTSASADIASTKLEVDLAEHMAVATIELARNGTVSLDVRGLDIRGVRDGRGNRRFRVRDGKLIVTSVYSPMEIEYGFTVHSMADGLLPGGSTVVWPYFCGNLFPCKSDPADGQTFTMSVTGAEGEAGPASGGPGGGQSKPDEDGRISPPSGKIVRPSPTSRFLRRPYSLAARPSVSIT